MPHNRHLARWALLGTLLMVASVTAVAPGSASGETDHTTTIRRTEYGIPHILADDYQSLGYGEGYAFGQDNPCALVQQAITLAGDRSRWFGPTAAAPQLILQGPPPSNLDSDLYYRSVNATGQIQRLLATPAPFGPTAQVRALVAGYVRGYDRYLHDQGVANLPDAACRGAAWMRPITEPDVWRRVYQFATGTLGGVGQFLEPILAAAPPSANLTRTAQPTVVGTPFVQQVIGSNALALGEATTTGHEGMVLANPHGPWTGQDRFYQMQLTIPGQLDVSGVTFYGLPLVMPFGHNQHLAFTATRASDTQYVVQRLALTPGDPTGYLVDGTRHTMTSQVITVPVPGTDGRVSTVRRTLYRTPDGPVIEQPGLYDWTTSTAYVVHDAEADNLRSLNELLAIGKAATRSQLHAAMATYQGLPDLNVFAADAQGTADYVDGAVVPHLTDSQAAACMSATDQAHFAATGEAVLDGSRSACRPGNDADAIEPGIFGPAELPHLTRADYVANSNDSPWLVNPAQPLSFPRIVGRPPGTMQSVHQRQAVEMINQRLAGTDGLGAPGFTVDTLSAMAVGAGNWLGEQWRDALVALCRAHPTLPASTGQPVDVRAACAVLAHWDLHANVNSRGEVLFREFTIALESSVTTLPWAVPFDPTHPLTTPSGLDTSLPAVHTALADAVDDLASHHLALDTPLGAVQRVSTANGPIPVHGCVNACYDTVGPDSLELTPAGVYEDVSTGASFLMVSELSPGDVHTRTVLTYGESDNPTSSHHWDQARLFSAKQWVTDRFTDAEITADPHLTSTILDD